MERRGEAGGEGRRGKRRESARRKRGEGVEGNVGWEGNSEGVGAGKRGSEGAEEEAAEGRGREKRG